MSTFKQKSLAYFPDRELYTEKNPKEGFNSLIKLNFAYGLRIAKLNAALRTLIKYRRNGVSLF